jgi:hypothetical protein
MLPSKMKDNKETVQDYTKRMIDYALDGLKHLNDIPEGDSYQLQCAGLNLNRPRTRLENNRIVVSMKLKTQGNAIPTHLKEFCDREDQELLKIDPRTFTDEQMAVIDDWVTYETHNQNFNYLFEIGKRGYVEGAKTFMNVMSPVVQAASSHEFLRDWCRIHHPRANNQRCAFVYFFAKGWEEYNMILDEQHQTIMDPRNEHDPNEIDINADEFLEVNGEIYADFNHYQAIHYNIRRDRFDKVMQ